MNLRRPPSVPTWLVVPLPATRVFAWMFAAWSAWKWFDAMTPRMCGDLPPLQLLAAVMATVEGSLGVFLALGGPELRAKAALAGAGTMIGLVGFSLVANVRRIATKHCFCFGGIDLPWTAHAAIAGALALVFLAILLDSERRRAASA